MLGKGTQCLAGLTPRSGGGSRLTPAPVWLSRQALNVLTGRMMQGPHVQGKHLKVSSEALTLLQNLQKAGLRYSACASGLKRFAHVRHREVSSDYCVSDKINFGGK